jgi:hypothetical protein
MLNPGDIERSDEVFQEMGESLAKAYHPSEFSIRAFAEARGWVRSDAPAHVRGSSTFVMAVVRPSTGPQYRFMIQREDALSADTHDSVMAFLTGHDFSTFESTDGKSYCYQFIPQRGASPARTKKWEAGTLSGEIVNEGPPVAATPRPAL